MANLLGGLNAGALSSSSQLLPVSRGIRQSSSQQPHRAPRRLAIGVWRETLIKAGGLKQDGSSRRVRSSPIKSQNFSTRLGEGVSSADSRSDQETASPSGIGNGSSASATYLITDRIERGMEAAYSATVPPPEAPTAQPMEMKRSQDAEDQHPYSSLKVAPRWREIHGEKHWAGMLDPLDTVLRGEIIRYGEFAQASYDAFDYNSHSPYCGSCKYSKKRLLQKVGLDNRGYEVTDYLYATAGREHPVASFLRKIDFDDKDDIDSDEVWDQESNWMGFVAVCTDPKEIARLGRRDIVVAWRGTVTKLEWLENLRDYLMPTAFDPRRSGQGSVDLKVEAGFRQLYTARDERSDFCRKSAREQVLEAVRRLVHQYRFHELSITVVGHSLGSALAKICAYDVAESSINVRLKPHDVDAVSMPDWEDPNGLAPQVEKLADQKMEAKLGPIPVTVFSFAGPRVGNDAFRDRLEELGVRVLRVANKNDKVTKIPGLVFNESMQFLEDSLKPFWKWLDGLPWTYSHVGVKIEVDNLQSPFLRNSKDALCAHNLEAYLHLVDGYHGPGRDFKPAIARDIALVNKACNLLKPKYFIPPNWFQEENKGLMRTKEGKWIPRLRDPDDRPENHSST